MIYPKLFFQNNISHVYHCGIKIKKKTRMIIGPFVNYFAIKHNIYVSIREIILKIVFIKTLLLFPQD